MRPRRRQLAALLAVLLGAAALGPATAAAAGPGQEVEAVAAVGVTVSDADRAADFFTGVLEFEKVGEQEVAGAAYEHLQGVFGLRLRVVRLRLGREFLELYEYLAPRGRPLPADGRSHDLWFQHVAIVVSDMDRAYQRLRENRVTHASSGPQTLPDWNPAAGGIRAFYFKDPDGHALELIQFPAGKGDPRWQVPSGRLFLGIDHTAIAVSDTDASLRLYRDALGMVVAGESENHGTEQEHLNNVFGARLRITSLRAAAGPGIELLEYLSPPGGRTAPADLQSNDLMHWQTRLVTRDPGSLLAAGRKAGARLVSPGLVELPGASLGFARGALLRDRDGHGLVLALNHDARRESP